MTVVTVRRDDSLMIREVDGQVVVLDVASNLVHRLNPTASFIWKQCSEDGALTAEDIARRVAETFEVDDHTARHDTDELLATLRNLRLIEWN